MSKLAMVGGGRCVVLLIPCYYREVCRVKINNFSLAYILLVACLIKFGLAKAMNNTFACSFVYPINYLGAFRGIVNAKLRSLSLLFTCVEDKGKYRGLL